jgi:hypothetical protein
LCATLSTLLLMFNFSVFCCFQSWPNVKRRNNLILLHCQWVFICLSKVPKGSVAHGKKNWSNFLRKVFEVRVEKSLQKEIEKILQQQLKKYGKQNLCILVWVWYRKTVSFDQSQTNEKNYVIHNAFYRKNLCTLLLIFLANI